MKTATLVLNIIFSIAFFPAVIAAMMSPMVFYSGLSFGAWAVFFAIIGIPISIFFTQIISWFLFFKGNYTYAIRISLIPVLFFLVLVIAFLFSLN